MLSLEAMLDVVERALVWVRGRRGGVYVFFKAWRVRVEVLRERDAAEVAVSIYT